MKSGRKMIRNGYNAERFLPDIDMDWAKDDRKENREAYENNRKDVGRQRIRWDLGMMEWHWKRKVE